MNAISSNILNTQKTDYDKPSLFLGQKLGIYDTINVHYPEFVKKFRELRAQDWDELEVDFTSCNGEFKLCSKEVLHTMKISLAWLWQADTVASRTVYTIVSALITNDQLARAWQKVAENESLHAATYSEILRGSFDNPDKIIDEIMSMVEALDRLRPVTEVFDEIYIKNHQYALGLIPNDQNLYNSLYLYNVGNLALERIQFMCAFKNIFGISKLYKQYVPISKAVQKICKDEYEIHVRIAKLVLEIESKTERGKIARKECMPRVVKLLNDVLESEIAFLKEMWKDDKELVGQDFESDVKFLHFNAQDVYDHLKIDLPFERVKRNPYPFFSEYVKIDNVQASPQEENSTNYFFGGFMNDLGDKVIDIEGL